MANASDLAGWRSGRLVALARVENDVHGKAQWVCRCDCGGAHIVRADNLKACYVRACPQCAGREKRDPLRLDAWYHLQPVGSVQTGFIDAHAGFVVARVGERVVACSPWCTGRVLRRQPPPVVAQAVRHFAQQGIFRCGTDPASVNGWIRRHKADIICHSHNEGDAVWTEWYARTKEWRGPVDDDAARLLAAGQHTRS